MCIHFGLTYQRILGIIRDESDNADLQSNKNARKGQCTPENGAPEKPVMAFFHAASALLSVLT